MTLRDLERHRQCGVSDGGSSYNNRLIYCCYCGDRRPHTIRRFAEHMLKEHDVVSRFCMPIFNQCPFCTFSRQPGAKLLQHILMCRPLFQPKLNLHCPASVFDFPLLPKELNNKQSDNAAQVKHGSSVLLAISSAPTLPVTPTSVAVGSVAPATSLHPSYRPPKGANFPLNVISGSRLIVGSQGAIVNVVPRSSSPPVVALGVRPGIPLRFNPLAMYSAAVRPGINPLPYPTSVGSHVPGSFARLFAARPAVPIGIIYSNGSPLSTMVSPSFVSPVQRTNIYSNNSAASLALNCSGSVSSMQEKSGGVVLLKSTDLAKAGVPNAGYTVTTSSSSLSSHAQSNSVSKRASVKINFGQHSGSAPLHGKGSSSKAKKTAARREPATLSQLFLKCFSSKPVVILHRLRVSSCEVCGLMFERPPMMHEHLQKVHNVAVHEKDFVQGSPYRPVPCICCPRRFFSKQGLERHMRIVHELLSHTFSCPRCLESGISDLITHFRAKHNLPLRTMVEWRVCYLCKLNFSTVSEVEMHVVSKHADIFPSCVYFRKAVRASFRQRNSTHVETQSSVDASGRKKNPESLGNLQLVNGECSKDNQPVAETVQDSSNLNLSTAASKKRKLHNAVDKPHGVTDARFNSPDIEPVKKKARRSGAVSAILATFSTQDSKTDQSVAPANEVHGQNSASERRSLPNVVSHAVRAAPVVVLPAERMESVSNSANRPANILDVSVNLTPLSSAHGVLDGKVLSQESEPLKKKARRSGTVSASVSDCSTLEVKTELAIPPKNKVLGQTLASTKDALGPTSGVSNNEPPAVLVPPKVETTKGGSSSASRPARLLDVSVHLMTLSSAKNGTQSGADATLHGTGSRPVKKISRKDVTLSAGASADFTPNTKTDRGTAPKNKAVDAAAEKDAVLVSREPTVLEPVQRRKSTNVSASASSSSVQNVVSSVLPPTATSSNHSARSLSVSGILVPVMPSKSLPAKESSVEKDGGRYRSVPPPFMYNYLTLNVGFKYRLSAC